MKKCSHPGCNARVKTHEKCCRHRAPTPRKKYAPSHSRLTRQEWERRRREGQERAFWESL